MFVPLRLLAATVPAIVVLPFLRTVIALLLAPAAVPLPTTRSLSVDT